ncbi:MAG: hypothetical protein KatS3mg022_1238 [Armatimonadota bacterium]|nr:MAG: hypothetical protein KatS3mg022_1238 [Armatimonadota bacterium]
MRSEHLEKIMKEVDNLTIEEIGNLIARLQMKMKTATPRRRWAEIAGKAPYPLTGEDAQQWVSRTRCDADEQRQSCLGTTHERS